MESNGYGQLGQLGQMDVAKFSNGGMGGAISGAILATPKSTPPMDVTVRNLGVNIERLQQAVAILSGKLEPVLYAEPPSNQTARGTDSTPRASSSLGSALNNYADQIDGLIDRVNALTRRCEL